MAMVGGFGAAHPVDDEVRAVAHSVKAAAETHAGHAFTTYEPHSYKSQVVAGTNFDIKVNVGHEFIHIRVYRPLPHTGQPNQLSQYHGGKTETDQL
mmetsp:Transcript_8395/g.16717  ORF Transcript_8395/g.16717 Transcript_8395/m.16717 type:complete len:96 (-) Transcript_8395:2393-2680(-)